MLKCIKYTLWKADTLQSLVALNTLNVTTLTTIQVSPIILVSVTSSCMNLVPSENLEHSPEPAPKIVNGLAIMFTIENLLGDFKMHR